MLQQASLWCSGHAHMETINVVAEAINAAVTKLLKGIFTLAGVGEFAKGV